MNDSARNKLSDAPVQVHNEEALQVRLKDAWAQVDKLNTTVAELKAQVKVLKEVIAERGY